VLTTGLLHLMTLMRAQLAVDNNLLCFLCALKSVKREKECQQSPSTHDKRYKPFNSRDTCASLARKIISKRKNDVIGENNLEPNTNCYHNVYYVAHSAAGRIQSENAKEERSVIWRGVARVGLK
jgi:hypothetical protein